MKKITIKDEKGFTLVELIVSFAIIAIIATTMLNLFGAGLLNITKAGTRTANTETATNNFLTNPEVISEEKTLSINLGINTEDNVEVKGRMGKGTGTLPGSYGNVEVEIEAFVPGL